MAAKGPKTRTLLYVNTRKTSMSKIMQWYKVQSVNLMIVLGLQGHGGNSGEYESPAVRGFIDDIRLVFTNTLKCCGF